jgi:transposase-like protein
VKCPACGSDNVSYLASVSRYKCHGKHPKAQFSLKVGTIFEDSPISLDKWLCAMWLIVNCKNGISSCEMARDLGITQKSAWFLDHRIRFALYSGSFEKMSGHVEADESFPEARPRFRPFDHLGGICIHVLILARNRTHQYRQIDGRYDEPRCLSFG